MHSQSQTLTPVPFHSANGGRGSKGKETITEGKGEQKNQETDGARKEESRPCADTRSPYSEIKDCMTMMPLLMMIFSGKRKNKNVDDNEEISDKIADDTNTTTIADDAETTTQRGGNVVTPRRFHAGHGTLPEAGVDCSGNSTLLHELHS